MHKTHYKLFSQHHKIYIKTVIFFLQNILDSVFWDNKINVHKRIDMSVIKLMDLQMLVFTECLPTACVRTLNQDRKHTIQKKLNINQSTKSTDRYSYVTIYDMLVESTNQFNFFIKMQQLNERETLSIKTYHQTSFNIKQCFFHTFLKLDKIKLLYLIRSWFMDTNNVFLQIIVWREKLFAVFLFTSKRKRQQYAWLPYGKIQSNLPVKN